MKYLDKYAAEVKSFVEVCHKLSANMFVTGHGGNLAWRLERNLILITPTRLNKGDINPGDVVFTDMAGKRLEGARKPTGELPMYLGFFKHRPDIVTAIHCHPPMTNVFAITGGKNLLMRPVFPETAIEVGPVPVVPYDTPLSIGLANSFVPYLQKFNAFLMENHGLVILSKGDIKWTMMLTELLEMSAASIIGAATIGPVKELSRKQVQDLDEVMRIRELPLFGAPGKAASLVEIFYPGKPTRKR